MSEYDGVDLQLMRPLSRAIDETRHVLFEPFRLEKWLAIGFCAWLANLAQGGGGGGGGNRGSIQTQGEGLRETWRSLSEVAYFLPLILAGAVLIVVLILLTLWLSSRGRFMFVHCIALNRGQVVRPWRQYRAQGNSLFRFRLAVGILWFMFMALVVGSVAVLIYLADQAGGAAPAAILALVVVGGPSLLLAIGFLVVLTLTDDFVVPVMLLRRCTAVTAWRELRPILRANAGGVILYLLLRLLLLVGVMVAVLTLGFACCCLLVLIILPYIGTVILLPVHVFFRSFALHYIAQLGPEYDAFTLRFADTPPQPYPGDIS